MRSSLALILSLLTLAGCSNRKLPIDPFIQPNTVPPPGTGQASNQNVADPYYRADVTPDTSTQVAAASRQSPPIAAPRLGSVDNEPVIEQESTPAAPLRRLADRSDDDGFRPNRSDNPFAELEADEAAVDRFASVARDAVDSFVQTDRVSRPGDSIRIIPPDAEQRIDDFRDTVDSGVRQLRDTVRDVAHEVDNWTQRQPTLAGELDDRPSNRRDSIDHRDDSLDRRPDDDVYHDDRVQLAAATEPVRSRASVSAATVRDPRRASYGFDPDYAWIKGKLEYLAAERRWKLRYIPIDGPTDDFGGSVILDNFDTRGEFAPGDFIAVQGTIYDGDADSVGFAPVFEVSRTLRLH